MEPPPPLGNGTYFYRYDSQNADGTWTGQLDKGLTTVGGLIARWRYNATVAYDVGSWNVSVTQNFQKLWRSARPFLYLNATYQLH